MASQEGRWAWSRHSSGTAGRRLQLDPAVVAAGGVAGERSSTSGWAGRIVPWRTSAVDTEGSSAAGSRSCSRAGRTGWPVGTARRFILDYFDLCDLRRNLPGWLVPWPGWTLRRFGKNRWPAKTVGERWKQTRLD